MVLMKLADGRLDAVARTTFGTEGIQERADLQAALRNHIAVLGDDLLVIAEEFGDFDGANRRIDLLCIDRTGRLVVIELKRTADGGHMELQALRYAAMISTMTVDDLERTYRKHLKALGDDEGEAEARLAEWLVDADEDAPKRDVRIMLVAADFNIEITSTVLWLADLYGLDISCFRLTPYRHGDDLLIDVQQVIPLPEAEALTVKLRRREHAKTTTVLGHDRTKFEVTTPNGTSDALPKRRAMLHLVTALHEHGVSADAIDDVLPNSKFLSIEGAHTDPDTIIDHFVAKHPNATETNMNRWFVEAPIIDENRTWLLANGWGLSTETLLDELIDLAPGQGFAVKAVR